MTSDARLRTFYEERLSERDRLGRREGQLEAVRTRELLERFLPSPPAAVIDVGGGTGAHAAWLAGKGYTVRLVDVVPAHVEAAARDGTYEAAVGDARALTEPDGAYDVALLLGPLYHLQRREDRLRALGEARRVVRPGGLVAAAFISRGAAVLDGYVKGWIGAPGTADIVRAQLRDGFARTDGKGFSAVSYFHRPSEARAELASAGLEVVATFGVEGPGWIAPDFDDRWGRDEGRALIIDTARMCDADPELQVLSAHLLAFCRRV